jgi:hypothetical protein
MLAEEKWIPKVDAEGREYRHVGLKQDCLRNYNVTKRLHRKHKERIGHLKKFLN